jgi:hypothetical protein
METPGIRELLFNATCIHERGDDVEPIQNLFAKMPPPDVNSIYYNFEGEMLSALHVTSDSGYSQIVAFLLQKGARQDPSVHLKYTPLHLAA